MVDLHLHSSIRLNGAIQGRWCDCKTFYVSNITIILKVDIMSTEWDENTTKRRVNGREQWKLYKIKDPSSWNTRSSQGPYVRHTFKMVFKWWPDIIKHCLGLDCIIRYAPIERDSRFVDHMIENRNVSVQDEPMAFTQYFKRCWLTETIVQRDGIIYAQTS
jgi:hypothetical protein